MKSGVAFGLGGLAAVLWALGLVAGCERSGGGGVSGTSVVQGNVVSFETAAAAPVRAAESRLAHFVGGLADLLVPCVGAASSPARGGVGGMVVSLWGPDDRSATTADNGAFSIANLPAGDYRVGFALNGVEVRYRGRSGQEAVLSVGTNETVELLNIRISGGRANIGNIKVIRHGP